MNSNRKKVLVIDGRSISALAVVRSLGKKGIEIHSGDEFSSTITSYSKYTTDNLVYPSPSSTPDSFVNMLVNIAKQEKYDLIIPTRDETTLLLSKHRSAFPDYTKLFVAEHSTLCQLSDKGKTMRLADRFDVPTPTTYYIDENGVDPIKESLNYPVLVKPRRSSGSRGIQYVHSEADLAQKYREVCTKYDNPIIQEYINHEGGHYSVGTLFNNDSEVAAVHVYKETKQYPPSGGPAIEAQSVAVKPWVNNLLEMLKEINWTGPAHMDLLYDSNDSTPKLLEVNPRLWTSLSLSVQAGVDFPYLLYQLSNTKVLDKPVDQYDTDLWYRWILPSGLLWMVKQQSMISSIKQVIVPSEDRLCYGVLSSDDPKASIGVAAQSLSFLSDKEKRQQIFDRGW
jgi:predicted ATP-grasp superfamily ATP-dependent carboligase